MVIRAYAVVCANGEIHWDINHAAMTQSRAQAALWVGKYAEQPCAPHKVTTLRGEVSLPRRRG